MGNKVANHKPQVLKDLAACLLSAVLLALAFPKFNLEFLAWFGFVPLLFVLQNKSKSQAFIFSYFTGVIFWSGIIYWLIHVTLPGMVLLILYLALYFGLFGLLVSAYLLPTTCYPLFIPSLWVLLEYARSHLFTGFGWALLGYSQYLNLPVIQIADITGAWGVSFLVMMVNVFIYWVLGFRFWIMGKKQKKFFPIGHCLLPSLFIVLSLGYGFYKLRPTPSTQHLTPIRVSVVQGDIPQEQKWDASFKDSIIDKYLNLTSQAATDKPDLIIWPEAALPVVLEEEPAYYERVRDFAKEAKTPLLLGSVTLREGFYYNSALLVSGQAELLTRYDKLHLVPFGEYIPLKKIFGFLETVAPIGDFSGGKEYTLFQVASHKPQATNNFAVLICFEDLFPQLSRQFAKRGAGFLVNITNDAWFKMTSAPYQHLSASVFRAVENRVFLVRAANTGVSGFIAPTGKIISLVQDESGRNIFISSYDTQEIPVANIGPSLYTKYGDVFILLCLIFSFYGAFRLIR